VMVDSKPNEGATFRILLPAIHAEPPILAPPAAQEGSPGAGTILVVEDEPAVRRMVCEMLRRMKYTVLEAAGPKPALSICESYPDEIDLMLTDVVMPDMNGYALAKQCQELRPGMQYLYMSGYAHDALTQSETVEPNAPFLQKPFTAEILRKKIREAVGRLRTGV